MEKDMIPAKPAKRKKSAQAINQKIRILYLLQIFWEETDETHGITLSEIQEKLAGYAISVDRKTLYRDIGDLSEYGLKITGKQEYRRYSYRITDNKRFQLAERKLLLDAVLAAEFITDKQTKELVKKIEALGSIHEKTQLERQIVSQGRRKSENEETYHNIEQIHTAIAKNEKITFQYIQWTVKKKPELCRKGTRYTVSPWRLSWNDEKYYLIGYDETEETMKYFRVDKIINLERSVEDRKKKERFQSFDVTLYTGKRTGMCEGKAERVRIECDNSLADTVMDRFGKDAVIISLDENRFAVTAKVVVNRPFLAWVIGLGYGAELVAPERAVTMMREEVERLERIYKK